MFGLIISLLAALGSDLTVDEPSTRVFGAVKYSEAVCTDHKQQYCEDKDTRVGVSMSPFYIYDFGDELRVIYKTDRCSARSFTSYGGISSKDKLRDVLAKARCPDERGAGTEGAIENLDDLHAATRYMKERAEFVFGPVSKRCWVKRSASGYPESTNCPRE